MDKNLIHLGSNTIEISNPQKIYYPSDGISKAEVVEYYHKIAETMLPHIQGRPLSMQRFPNGIEGPGFYEKRIPEYFPDWIERTEVHVEGDKETQEQVVCNSAAALVYIAEQGCITPHAWLSRAGKLEYPDKMVFDLDPPADDFGAARHAARALHKLLDAVGLASFLMTTGSRGVHVVVPLDATTDFETTRSFAKALLSILAGKESGRLTTEVRKNKRKGRLFLDYLRNSYAQTSVPPYALRARPGAPIATPLEWDELDKSDLHSQKYTMKNIFHRIARKGDPWQDFFTHPHRLSEHVKELEGLKK